ncbi:hypothetical protein QBC38DRAFT_454006 [Podospora fimiseda]|uniref:Uncharacterized protein n=1 Tax=Podospora fimiseda TaxID=252190 RepID=A0AAN7H5R1_9PEZI|nr:hypothetical protein QBC38DRAFT_454006 [Podospora fimiseda]
MPPKTKRIGPIKLGPGDKVQIEIATAEKTNSALAEEKDKSKKDFAQREKKLVDNVKNLTLKTKEAESRFVQKQAALDEEIFGLRAQLEETKKRERHTTNYLVKTKKRHTRRMAAMDGHYQAKLAEYEQYINFLLEKREQVADAKRGRVAHEDEHEDQDDNDGDEEDNDNNEEDDDEEAR